MEFKLRLVWNESKNHFHTQTHFLILLILLLQRNHKKVATSPKNIIQNSQTQPPHSQKSPSQFQTPSQNHQKPTLVSTLLICQLKSSQRNERIPDCKTTFSMQNLQKIFFGGWFHQIFTVLFELILDFMLGIFLLRAKMEAMY